MSLTKALHSSPDDDGPLVRSLGEAVFEVTLSQQNRINFFQDYVQTLNDSREEAELALRNLQTWSPKLAEHFQIRDPDGVLNTPFRLICESDLGYVPFDAEKVIRQFLAVSYCWHDNDPSWLPEGSQPHAPWPFSKPFVEAVLAERGVHTDDPQRNENFRREAIWIDQMCIRQGDEVEKQQCIAMMDMIYASCRKMLILLEDVTFDSEDVMLLEKHSTNMLAPSTINRPLSEVEVRRLAEICAKIENSRWWSRAWCFHEFEANRPWSDMRHLYYAHNATFIVKRASPAENGTKTFGLKLLTLQWARSVTIKHALVADGTLNRKILRWTIFDNKFSRYNDPTHRGRGTLRSSLMACYFLTVMNNCTFPSDIASITINLSGLAIYVVDCFQDPDQVFFAMTMLALACGERTPLTWIEPPKIEHPSTLTSTYSTISWLARPLDEFGTSLPKFTVGSIEGIYNMTPQNIELDLIFFEAPVEVITDEELAKTQEIFPDIPIRSREVRMQDGQLDLSTTSNNDDKHDKGRRFFLTAALKLGLNGICRLWNVLNEEVVQPSFNHTRFEPFRGTEVLRPAARRLLSWLSVPSSGNSVPVSSHENLNYEEILLSFLTFITDPRASYLTATPCGWIQCNDESRAIVKYPMLRYLSLYRDQTKFRLAIPTDLIACPSDVTRAWVLQPLDEGGNIDTTRNSAGLYESTAGKWRLVGKTCLLGEPNISSKSSDLGTANRFVSLRERQFVQG